jgi:hypothetical protein
MLSRSCFLDDDIRARFATLWEWLFTFPGPDHCSHERCTYQSSLKVFSERERTRAENTVGWLAVNFSSNSLQILILYHSR